MKIRKRDVCEKCGYVFMLPRGNASTGGRTPCFNCISLILHPIDKAAEAREVARLEREEAEHQKHLVALSVREP